MFLLCLTVMFSISASASLKVRILRSKTGYKIISVEKSSKNNPFNKSITVRSIPYILSEDKETQPDLFQEFIISDNAIPVDVNSFWHRQPKPRPEDIPGSEVRIIVEQGPKQNRINLTILGDGYTTNEKAKFFADAQRTTQNLFTGSTFASYLPLFNVYAVFVPSSLSGIGDGRPKNTAFKLYRNPPGSKRAIMPGDTAAAEAALRLAPATDYPIILANDEFYGGLGGRFAISTSSVKSGLIVLRHELGHNFGEVGEEYDGGQVYTGANTSGPNVSWSQWVDGALKLNQATQLAGDYVWQNLNGHPYKQNFNFPSTPGMLFLADISTVGWATPDDVITTIDNRVIKLTGEFTNDRRFYNVGPVTGLSAGPHSIQFTENIHDGDNVLAFSRLYAFPSDYDFTPMKVGAFATYNDSGQKVGYRPTHDSCLMRNMMNPYFCSVDKENMWLKFLSRVNLIDSVSVTAMTRNPRADKVVTAAVPKLMGLEVRWYQVGGGSEVEMPQFKNLLTWKAPAAMAGTFKLRVQFRTPEVRKYTPHFQSEASFNL